MIPFMHCHILLIYLIENSQMSIQMSKLEFFFNRPTLVALIGFGLGLSSPGNVVSNSDSKIDLDDKSLVNKEKNDEYGRVKGLLGYGKDRVVFYLSMNVGSVSVFLNKEDGSQLAKFVQEHFLLDLKVLCISLLLFLISVFIMCNGCYEVYSFPYLYL